jgi:hypothetical protein
LFIIITKLLLFRRLCGDVNFCHLYTGLVNGQNLRGPWHVSAVKEFAMGWIHETFGKRNRVGKGRKPTFLS